APVVERAREAVNRQPVTWQAHNTFGAALYRSGKYEEAVAELTKATSMPGGEESPSLLIFMAMGYFQLGKPAHARIQLQKASEAHNTQPPVSWEERVEWQVLHREAETLLNSPAPMK